jgi:hypothetical protein
MPAAAFQRAERPRTASHPFTERHRMIGILDPVYLRNERRPHPDPTLPDRPVVVYYEDPKAKREIAYNPWPSRPRKQDRYIRFQCDRRRAVWLPDAVD